MPEQAPISFSPYLETSSNPSLPGNCTEGDLIDVGCDLCDMICPFSHGFFPDLYHAVIKRRLNPPSFELGAHAYKLPCFSH